MKQGQAYDAKRVRQARDEAGIDLRAVESAVVMLLHAIGEDPAREGLEETPGRVARAYQEIFAGMREDPSQHLEKQFVAQSTGLVIQKDIPFYSVCEHHMVPFHGRAAVAYVPNQSEPKVVGLSKLARCVRGYAARLQIQERMTMEIANAVMGRLDAFGCVVVVEAEHLCMGMRGVKAPGSITITSEVRGVFKDDASARSEVMQLLR